MKFIENVAKEDYINFSESHAKSHFLQSYAWGEFCNEIKGQIPCYVGILNDNNELIATCLILLKKTPFGFSYGYAPRGFILDYNELELIASFTNYLKEYMKKEKIIYIKFDPDIKYQDIDSEAMPIENENNNYELYNYMLELGYIHKGFNKLYEGNQPRYTFRINLRNDWEQIESKFSKSFMKSIKRSYNYNLIIDNKEVPENFIKLAGYNSAKNSYDAHNLKYYQVLTDKLSKNNNLKYFNVSLKPKEVSINIKKELDALKESLNNNPKKEADIKNQISKLEKDYEIFKNIDKDELMVCSLICTYTKNRAWSLFIGSDEMANQTFAVSRSYYEAIKDAYARKLDFFDLFGTTGDPHTTYKNLAKLHDFKRKFGDEYTEFIGEFDLVNKKILYKLLPGMLKVYRDIRKLKNIRKRK